MGTSATKAKSKYNKNNYDQIAFKAKKGTKEVWIEEALQRNMSLSQFIQTAVALYIKNYTDNTQLCKNDMQNEKEPQSLIQ